MSVPEVTRWEYMSESGQDEVNEEGRTRYSSQESRSRDFEDSESM
jgi:hypothetical protein